MNSQLTRGEYALGMKLICHNPPVGEKYLLRHWGSGENKQLEINGMQVKWMTKQQKEVLLPHTIVRMNLSIDFF